MSEAIQVESVLGWKPDADEHRRAFIIENTAPYDWSIKDMRDLYDWLKHGDAKAVGSPILRPVK